MLRITIKIDVNVVLWRQRKHLAQLRTRSHWLAVETGRFRNARVERAQRLCHRWAHHIWLCCNGCWAAETPVSVYTWTSCFGRLYHPGPNRIGCVCARLLLGLQRVISDNVLFIHGCLVRRPIVGYLYRPEMASNRLCITSIIVIITMYSGIMCKGCTQLDIYCYYARFISIIWRFFG